MPRKRRSYPIDPMIVFTHPGAIALPSAAFGSLMRLLLHWLATDCNPIPVDNDELRAVARAHRPTWAQHKDQVLLVFEDLKADFEADRARRAYARDRLAKWAAKGTSRTKLKSLERKVQAPVAPPRSESISQMTPIGKARLDRAPETKPGAGGFVDR